MKRLLTVLLVIGMWAGLAAPAWAHGNPHFISVDATRVGDNLRVDFKEAGLGNSAQAGETITIEARADAEASWQCFNKAGNRPQGRPHRATEQASASGEFSADRNGQVTGSLVITPPLPEGFSCSPGHVGPVLISVVYSNVQVHDLTHGVSSDLLPGPF